VYGEPNWAVGRVAVVIVRDVELMTSVAVWDAVNAGLLESETVKVTEVLPLEVGFPEMTPVLPRLRPAGNALEDQV
jgi:hypothetical protein